MTDKSAAFMRASNLLVMDYPYQAAIASALRLCDELCIVVGQSVDNTREAIAAEVARYPGRIKVKEQTFTFDLGWQERWFDTCLGMTDAEWILVQDGDEVIHEEHTNVLRGDMADPETWCIVFPFVHLYGTADYRVADPSFYRHNSRLGRRSRGYRMRNWRAKYGAGAAACQMVLQHPQHGSEFDAHSAHGPGIVWTDVPVMHYGWCRTPQALAISQAKHFAWYADGDGLQNGKVPDVTPYDYRLTERLSGGFVEPYRCPHPADIQPWLDAHAAVWAQLTREGVRA